VALVYEGEPCDGRKKSSGGRRAAQVETPRFETMCQKLKELFVEAKDPGKIYFIEKTTVSWLRGAESERKKGAPK
jgi:hypothetical protein